MTNKTKSELEKLRNNWKVAITLLTILILISWVCWVIDFSAWRGCENQLQECQDKVPVTEHSLSFWTNHTGEWEMYVISKEEVKRFYKNGEEIYIDCKDYSGIAIYNYTLNQEEVIFQYLCEVETQIAIWDMIKEDLKCHKEVWCEVNEIENCEVIK